MRREKGLCSLLCSVVNGTQYSTAGGVILVLNQNGIYINTSFIPQIKTVYKICYIQVSFVNTEEWFRFVPSISMESQCVETSTHMFFLLWTVFLYFMLWTDIRDIYFMQFFQQDFILFFRNWRAKSTLVSEFGLGCGFQIEPEMFFYVIRYVILFNSQSNSSIECCVLWKRINVILSELTRK